MPWLPRRAGSGSWLCVEGLTAGKPLSSVVPEGDWRPPEAPCSLSHPWVPGGLILFLSTTKMHIEQKALPTAHFSPEATAFSDHTTATATSIDITHAEQKPRQRHTAVKYQDWETHQKFEPEVVSVNLPFGFISFPHTCAHRRSGKTSTAARVQKGQKLGAWMQLWDGKQIGWVFFLEIWSCKHWAGLLRVLLLPIAIEGWQ